MSTDFAPWQQRAFDLAMQARAADRLPHALLICGPELLGKRELAAALAQRLLCTAAAPSARACNECRNCNLFLAGTHPDYYVITFELNDKGDPRSEITVDQMRALGSRLVLTPQLGGAQIALLHPAEALNRSAFNALLKTLEEPPPGRYLILVSDQPYRLPATIRSRCQRLEVRPPPREEARAWLIAQGSKATAVDEALDANEDHPGQARRDLLEDGLALRASVAKDLAALATGRERAAIVAQRWVEDRLPQRLRCAVEAVREYAASRASPAASAGRLVAAGLPPSTDPRPLARWFDEANRVRDLLRTPLRQELMLGELLRAWRQACAQGVKIPPGNRTAHTGG